MKRILGTNRSTTNILIRGELNRHSLQEEILRRNINYAKYINKKDSGIVKQAYDYEINRPPECSSFFNTIKKHEHKLQALHKCFLPLKHPLENIFHTSDLKLKSYTYQIFHNEWKSNLDTSIKGETYKRFKNNMKLEPYLKFLNRKQRVSLTKLRVSDHKLMIEEGRRKTPKIPRENRTCKMCLGMIEDEPHFLTNCVLYGSRIKLFQNFEVLYPNFHTLNNDQKFIYLMSQENSDITTALAKAILE